MIGEREGTGYYPSGEAANKRFSGEVIYARSDCAARMGLAQLIHQRPEGRTARGFELMQPNVNFGEHLFGVVKRTLGKEQVAVAKLFEWVVHQPERHFNIGLDQLDANAVQSPMVMVRHACGPTRFAARLILYRS